MSIALDEEKGVAVLKVTEEKSYDLSPGRSRGNGRSTVSRISWTPGTNSRRPGRWISLKGKLFNLSIFTYSYMNIGENIWTSASITHGTGSSTAGTLARHPRIGGKTLMSPTGIPIFIPLAVFPGSRHQRGSLVYPGRWIDIRIK